MWAYWLAGLFALIAIWISLVSISRHLLNYKMPVIQRLLVRILFMPVVYATCSWISMGSDWAGDVLEPIRDCYEAFVLWMFFQLLMYYLGGESVLLQTLDDGRLPVSHSFPFNMCLPPIDFAEHYNFIILKRAILQFVLVKPIHAIVVGLLKIIDYNNDGVISNHNGFLVVALIYNFSVMICMYGLVQFYRATSYDLSEHKPMLKFLCIKAVIFFSFWQSLLIMLLYKGGLLGTDANPERIQDFLICLEMVVAAIAHTYAFGYEEYAELESARLPWPLALKDSLVVKDLFVEIRHTWRGTKFRGYNDLLERDSTANSPLIASSERRFVPVSTKLEFDEINPNGSEERLYKDAAQIGHDYNYPVI